LEYPLRSLPLVRTAVEDSDANKAGLAPAASDKVVRFYVDGSMDTTAADRLSVENCRPNFTMEICDSSFTNGDSRIIEWTIRATEQLILRVSGRNSIMDRDSWGVLSFRSSLYANSSTIRIITQQINSIKMETCRLPILRERLDTTNNSPSFNATDDDNTNLVVNDAVPECGCNAIGEQKLASGAANKLMDDEEEEKSGFSSLNVVLTVLLFVVTIALLATLIVKRKSSSATSGLLVDDGNSAVSFSTKEQLSKTHSPKAKKTEKDSRAEYVPGMSVDNISLGDPFGNDMENGKEDDGVKNDEPSDSEPSLSVQTKSNGDDLSGNKLSMVAAAAAGTGAALPEPTGRQHSMSGVLAVIPEESGTEHLTPIDELAKHMDQQVSAFEFEEIALSPPLPPTDFGVENRTYGFAISHV